MTESQWLSVEVIAIGDELLSGRTSDTNSTFLGQRLFENGARLERVTVIADHEATILETLRARAEQAQVIFVTGGLGPTTDDLTAGCAAKWLGTDLAEDPATRARLEAFCRRRNRPVTPQNLKQCVYPRAAQPIPNPAGLAVGFHAKWKSCDLFFMPGVPSEMKAMFDQTILPWFRGRSDAAGTRIWSQTWRTIDLPESELQRHMDPIEAKLPVGAWLGYRTQFPENHLTLYWKGGADKPPAEWPAIETEITQILAKFTYGFGEETIEAQVFRLLRESRRRIALVESCTGGYALQRLTRFSGASEVVWGGWGTYQVDAKARMLGVALSDAESAMTPAAARQLAESALAKSGCDLVGCITGRLGRVGEDPVGFQAEVYVCVGRREGVGGKFWERTVPVAPRGREPMQWAASAHLLNALRLALLD